MASEDTSIPARTAAALAQLQPIASQVQSAAEELSRPISVVDAAIRQLHVAFEAWVTYKFNGPEPLYNNWQIGYTRWQGRWGICLRVIDGHVDFPEREDSETWHFNESPLFLRARAVDKLPDLIEALAKTGQKVAHKLSSAATQAVAIAETVTPPPKSKK